MRHGSGQPDLFDSGVADKRLLEAVEALQLGEWLASLPNGLESEVAHHGSSLSAGEAQMLALARVALRDPSVVILGEDSSRMDPVTEARVEQALDRLIHGRTAIVIAHRLRTIQRASRIVVLDDGRLLESGGRSELMADPDSRLAHLLRTGHVLESA